ncbi:MAG: BatD family protein [Melioribacteraceae bacterium]|nr:BatD family protein [Melioribacteraceae bacterium]MCF8355119.1 BatD family protein [Melioribacteraceae bacterium]MCF8392404.1 BatD family protein [Melioribacteraceae bacterium]MCF8417925.1 BatD family protein [Melioribacteraceae bacterium]
MKKVFQYILILFITAGYSFAQTFESSVDRTTVGQNERFQVYFTFNGEDINKLKNFRPPSFTGFRILSGPNQSTSMQIINGSVSASITYSYIITAPEHGEFKIDKATVSYEGESYETKPLNIKVVKGNSQQPQTQGNNQSGISEEELGKNVFIRAIPDRRSVYKGEQITITYKLYTRLNISSPQISKLPAYKGFWAEDLESSNNISFDIEMYEGERFRVATIKRVALFPTQSGDLSVTPFELKIPVLIKKRSNKSVFDDFFNDPFFSRTETIEYMAKSNTVTVNVKPLPGSNVPESFLGAVGDFAFSATIDKNNVDANEAITLRVRVSGRGNIKLLDLPKVNLPPGFEIYDPKISENINRTGLVRGEKSAEYLIVPRVPGVKEIDAIKFSYFDPAKNKYIELSSSPYTINVNRVEGIVYDNTTNGFSKEDVRLLSEDVRFIKTSSVEFVRKSDLSIINSWFWYSLIFPLLILLFVLGIQKKREKLHGNVQLMKFRKAEKLAKTRLKAANKALNENRVTDFYSELSQALFGFLQDKLNIQKSEFTLDRAVSVIRNKGVDEELINRVNKIYDQCEFARFAPKVEIAESAPEFYDKTVKVIVDLEGAISSKGKK